MRYVIRIEGRVEADESVFEPLTVERHPAETVLYGEVADQPALHGVLDLVQDLGLKLLEVRRLPGEPVGTARSASR